MSGGLLGAFIELGTGLVKAGAEAAGGAAEGMKPSKSIKKGCGTCPEKKKKRAVRKRPRRRPA